MTQENSTTTVTASDYEALRRVVDYLRAEESGDDPDHPGDENRHILCVVLSLGHVAARAVTAEGCPLTSDDIESLRKVIAYLWDDKLRSFTAEGETDERPRDTHVFRDVYKLAKLALGASVLSSRSYSESGVRYALVRVNGIDAVEKDGEVEYTEWDGDYFPDAVGIFLGAATELAVALKS